MKKMIFLFLIFGIVLSAKAEKNDCNDSIVSPKGIEVKVGMMFNPQITIMGNKPSEGFHSELPLFALLPVKLNKTTLSLIYTVNEENSYGMILEHLFSDKKGISAYIIATKKTHESGGMYGVGLSKEIAKNLSLFIETNNFFECEYFFCAGISMSGLIPINKKTKLSTEH